MDIQGKTAIVTGSASGLGLAMIEEFAEKGANCIVSDINAEAVEKTVASLKAKGAEATGIVTDVSNEESVISLFTQSREKYKTIDIVVCNAGILRDGSLIRVNKATGAIKSKMSLEQWQSVIDVNLTGVFLTGREAAAAMAEQGTGGVIIPISSVAKDGNRGQTNYSAAKAGVAVFCPLWADELARFQIRVAGIAPGFIGTQMVLKDMNQKALDMWKAKIPIGRLGEPSEIAKTATFIVENELINGVCLEATGGIRF